MRASALQRIGRLFVAVGMIAFGILFFVFAGSVAQRAPPWPAWVPGEPWALARRSRAHNLVERHLEYDRGAAVHALRPLALAERQCRRHDE